MPVVFRAKGIVRNSNKSDTKTTKKEMYGNTMAMLFDDDLFGAVHNGRSAAL